MLTKNITQNVLWVEKEHQLITWLLNHLMVGWRKSKKTILIYIKTNGIHKMINEYIRYFNNDRLVFSLKYKSTAQYRTELSFK